MDQISRKQILHVADALKEALLGVDAPGMKLEVGRSTYGYGAKVTILVHPVSEDGTVTTPEADAFTRYAVLDGMKPEWLGQTFTDRSGAVHTITGYKTRARKRPVTTVDSDGRRLVWPAAAIVAHMKGAN